MAPVGLPGSGKTTLCNRLIDAGLLGGQARISTDAIRELIGDSRSWLGDEKAVFELCDRIAKLRLKNRLDCFYDATNLDPQRRALLRAICLESRSRLIFIQMQAPVEVCERRRYSEGRNYTSGAWAQLLTDLNTVRFQEADEWLGSDELTEICASGEAD